MCAVETLDINKKKALIYICIPERSNSNLSLKLFDYIIIFVHSRKQILYPKPGFKPSF